ncbi:MAG: hypothetical protein IJH79_12785 [Lentisphaeria bacterium]|nr:hypothetical protein [Lentisphaeria bacterium]
MAITADEYFAAGAHLDAEYWSNQDAAVRTAALTMAETMIRTLLPASFTFNDTAWKAVFEQAVFLIRNHSAQTTGKVVTTQTIGELSQTFSVISKSGRANLSPAAEMLVELARKQMPRSVRFVRG